jgi:hypothetical protein
VKFIESQWQFKYSRLIYLRIVRLDIALFGFI